MNPVKKLRYLVYSRESESEETTEPMAAFEKEEQAEKWAKINYGIVRDASYQEFTGLLKISDHSTLTLDGTDLSTLLETRYDLEHEVTQAIGPVRLTVQLLEPDQDQPRARDYIDDPS